MVYQNTNTYRTISGVNFGNAGCGGERPLIALTVEGPLSAKDSNPSNNSRIAVAANVCACSGDYETCVRDRKGAWEVTHLHTLADEEQYVDLKFLDVTKYEPS